MANINDVFPSNYLKASDLQGRETTLVISSCAVEQVGGKGGDVKPVLYFQGKQKGLALNKVNANTIAGMYGPETDNWVGRRVTIFPTQTEYAGKQVACIRVKIGMPQGNGAVPVRPVAPVTQAEVGAVVGMDNEIDESSIPF